MSREPTNKQGLSHGRNWSALPADDGPIEWSLDPALGLVQGPLDLEFLRGKKVSLVLEPGQMALLVGPTDLKAIYLDGAHYLEIGRGGSQIEPACRLIFLATERSLDLRWTKLDPVCCPNGGNLALIGACSLTIDGPARFYQTFLAGIETFDQDFVLRLVDGMVRHNLAEFLRPSGPDRGADASGLLQSRLTALTAADLNESLAPAGLCCTHLAVYTAAPPVEGHEAETAGQSHEIGPTLS